MFNFVAEDRSTRAENIRAVQKLVRVTFQYGFIPFIIYLGFKKGGDPSHPLELSK